jgi:hypothetical protein
LAALDGGGTITPMRWLGFACAVVLAWTPVVQAKREQSFSYPYSRVWTAALRMLRVDFNSPITEKDRESGYFLFEYPDGGKSYEGSAEIVRVTENGVETARVVFQMPGLPSYYEQMLLDRLTRKLEQDYGSPPEAKPPAEEPAKDRPKKEGEGGGNAESSAKSGAEPAPQKPAAKP